MLIVIKYICNFAPRRWPAVRLLCQILLFPLCAMAADDSRQTRTDLSVVSRPQNGGHTGGSGKYAPGTVVEITAVPAEGFLFSKWEGSVVNPTSPATKTYVGNDAMRITAVFEPRRHMVDARVVPFGAGSIDGSGYQISGVATPLHAQPAPGYVFEKWEGPVKTPGSASTTLQAPLRGTISVTAYFKPVLESFKVTVLTEPGGTATGSGEYKRGTTVQLKATPSKNFTFAGWEGPVASTGTRETSLYVSGDTTVTAKFKVSRSLLRGRVSPEGAGRVVGDFGSKPAGVPVPVKAEAAPGFVFVRWEGPVADRKNPSTTITPEAGGPTVAVAHFERIR